MLFHYSLKFYYSKGIAVSIKTKRRPLEPIFCEQVSISKFKKNDYKLTP